VHDETDAEQGARLMHPGFMFGSGHDRYAMVEDSRLESPCVRGFI
jgi:hypothetical protein